MGQRSVNGRNVAARDARTELCKEECALDMVHSENDAAAKDALIIL